MRQAEQNLTRRLGNKILDVVYPRTCLSCSTRVRHNLATFVCPDCLDKIIFIGDSGCRKCGTKVGPGAKDNTRCVACRGSTFVFRRCVAVGMYDGPLRDLIINLKFKKNQLADVDLGKWIADRFEEKKKDLLPDFIVPVPLHRNRKRARGFDQAELLATQTARRGSVPLGKFLIRERDTEPQANLPPTRRRENLKGAFKILKKTAVDGKRILLVDDVMTTGATLAECSRVLKAAGASRIDCLVLARTTGV